MDVKASNENYIFDVDAQLDAKFGMSGTSSRIEAEEKAWAFYCLDTRAEQNLIFT